MNIFEPASNDQSIYYLGEIFGGVGTTIKGQDPSTVSQLGNMFQGFNTVILSVAVLVVIYTTIMGVMATAHEGEFLGKQWHKIWTPIRMVLGVAALVPTASGYSAIQIILMWIIVQGVGAADQLWSRVLTFNMIVGSPSAKISPNATQVLNTYQGLFKGLVCAATAQTDYKGTAVTNGYCTSGNCLNTSETDFSNMINTQLQNAYSTSKTNAIPLMPIDTSCGKLTVCNPAQCDDKVSKANPNVQKGSQQYQLQVGLCQAACNAQQSVLQSTLTTLSTYASRIALADKEYATFVTTSNNLRSAQPQWIQDYCVAKNIPSNLCCFPSSLPGFLASFDKNSCPIDAAGYMPPLSSNSQNNGSSTVDSDTLKNFYWIYRVKPDQDADFIDTVKGQYTSALGKAVNDYISSQTQDSGTGNSGNKFGPGSTYQEANDVGWILAGAYYYVIAKKSDSNQAFANPDFSFVVDPDPSVGGNIASKRNNYKAATDLLAQASSNNAQNNSNGVSTQPPPSDLGPQYQMIGSGGNQIMRLFMDTVSGNGILNKDQKPPDPLVQMQTLGRGILITIEILFWALLALTFGLALAGNISVFVLGTGIMNPLGGTMRTVYFFIVPVVLAFMGTFLSLGGMLAVYVPLIPYVIFFMGSLGWLMAVIEAMVAGPLVALGILSPSHHGHEILGKAEPALMLIFGTFLRPTLMIFGMMAGMLLAVQGARLINSGFQLVMNSLTYPTPSLLELIFFMASYVMLMIAMLNKCFALIYLIPERVMRWISGHADQYGEAEGLSTVREGTTAAMGVAAGAAAATQPKTAEAFGQAASSAAANKMKEDSEVGTMSAGGKGTGKFDGS